MDDRGQATVEAALMLPIVLFVILGMFTYGLVVHSRIVVTDAAREGARAYALGLALDEAETREKVEEQLQNGGLRLENLQPIQLEGTGVDAEFVELTVIYHQSSFVPLLPLLIGGEQNPNYFEISHTSTFKKERSS